MSNLNNFKPFQTIVGYNLLDELKNFISSKTCIVTMEDLWEIFKSNLNTRVTGSAALDLAYTGSGRFDGFFQNNISLWDIAAGIVIVKEAGGKINDLNKYSSDNINIRASSININNKMLEKLNNF